LISASSYSNDSSVHRSGGFFSSIGDGILKADDAMNRMLNRSHVAQIGKGFDKMGLGPLHLGADLCGHAAFKCMEMVGRMFGGQGKVESHFDTEWGAHKPGSDCKTSNACGTAHTRDWSHTRGRLDTAAYCHDGVSRSGSAHQEWSKASSVDIGAARFGASAQDGVYRSTTTQTHMGADGSLGQSTTSTRIASGNAAARHGWADAGFSTPLQCAGALAATDIAARYFAREFAAHANLIAPGYAAHGSRLSMEIRYA